MRGFSRYRLKIAIAILWSLGAATGVDAQARREFVGPGKCVDCHDHKDEKEWSEKRDGDGKGKQHKNALNQLADPKADEYAKVLRVDVYDVKSTCVKCHATVVRAEANDGISCESCHGAGKDYLKPHQEKGAYQASLALGLKDVRNKPDNWVRDCVTCHVLGDNPGDAELVKAGHPSGSDFTIGTKFQPVANHWTSKYTANQVAAIGEPIRTALLVRLNPRVPAGVSTPVPTSTPPSPPNNPPAPPNNPNSGGGGGSAPPSPPPGRVTGEPLVRGPASPRGGNVAAPPPLLPPPAPSPVAPTITTAVDAPEVQTPAGLVGALQGRVAQLLSDLLNRGVRTPVKLTAPVTKTPYRGPDAELLRLQEEVIALALEALGTAPPVKTVPPPK